MSPPSPVARFHAEGRPRVWSLIVTLLGDVALPRGGRMPSRMIADILAPMAIKEGAVRTALSRLAQDDWVIRGQNGRESQYSLAPRALAETRSASRRIYAPPGQDVWTLGLGRAPAPEGAALLQGGWIAPGRIPGAVASQGEITAQPREGQLGPGAHRAALEAMAADLADPATGIDPLTRRVLLIHRWRRLILRFGELPPALEPPHSLGDAGLRAAMAEAYHRALPASEAALPMLPPASPALFGRFREAEQP
mgnify:CR=1 FL=1